MSKQLVSRVRVFAYVDFVDCVHVLRLSDQTGLADGYVMQSDICIVNCVMWTSDTAAYAYKLYKLQAIKAKMFKV